MEPVIEILAKKDVGSFYPVFCPGSKTGIPLLQPNTDQFFPRKSLYANQLYLLVEL